MTARVSRVSASSAAEVAACAHRSQEELSSVWGAKQAEVAELRTQMSAARSAETEARRAGARALSRGVGGADGGCAVVAVSPLYGADSAGSNGCCQCHVMYVSALGRCW